MKSFKSESAIRQDSHRVAESEFERRNRNESDVTLRNADGSQEPEDDFGSTNSLESSSNSLSTPFKHASSSKTQDRVIRLDPLVYRKHRERNISLRSNLSEKLMKPAVLTDIRKMDKLSENISNHQILVQDVLFQSRIVTSNLEQLQKQLGKFGTENYLKEIKTGSSIADQNFVEIDIPSTNGNMSTLLPL